MKKIDNPFFFNGWITAESDNPSDISLNDYNFKDYRESIAQVDEDYRETDYTFIKGEKENFFKPDNIDLDSWKEFRNNSHYISYHLALNHIGYIQEIAQDISDMLLTIIDKELPFNDLAVLTVENFKTLIKLSEGNKKPDELFENVDFTLSYFQIIGLIRALAYSFIAIRNLPQGEFKIDTIKGDKTDFRKYYQRELLERE